MDTSANNLAPGVVGHNVTAETVELGKARIYASAADHLIARGNTGELTQLYLAAANTHAQIALALTASDRDYV